MIFTSFSFIVFFILVFAAYWLMPRKEWRLHLLLAASAVFYGWWDWRFLGLIALVIGVSWLVARQLAAKPNDRLWRKRWLSFGVVVALGVLGFFKYTGFFAESFAELMGSVGLHADMPTLRIILPVGISFYVFQAISYMVDVYRRDLPTEPRLTRVALYIAFFPQLVAGPIVRAASFFPQMERQKRLSRRALVVGVRAFVIGLTYKALIADNLAPVVDQVYSHPHEFGSGAIALATLAFAAQIYFDFAGYSMMAIGIARLFGYHIPRNFNYPYVSTSITEFWRRWHISLSTWLRDYLFIPLGGSRVGKFNYFRNLMATMVLGGLWHGAAWTFVIWGTLQGVALVIHKLWMEHASRHLPQWFGTGTMLRVLFGFFLTQYVVLISWAIFRARDLSDAVAAVKSLLGFGPVTGLGVSTAVALVLLPLFLDHWVGTTRWRPHWKWLSRPELWWAAAGGATALALALYPLKAAPFVYFQF